MRRIYGADGCDSELTNSCVLGTVVNGGRGEMMFVEDTAGKGRRVEVLDGPPFTAEFVALKRPGNFAHNEVGALPTQAGTAALTRSSRSPP